MIISLVNQKGGVGKTTLTVNVADCLQRRSAKVLVVDTDQQGTLTYWYAARQKAGLDMNFAAANVSPTADLPEQLYQASLAEQYDHVIVDTAGVAGEHLRWCLQSSDMVVIPVNPSIPDVWASEQVIKTIQDLPESERNFGYSFVITRRVAGTTLGNEIPEHVRNTFGHCFETYTSQRMAYPKSFDDYKTVFEISRAEAAQREIEMLTDEILAMGADYER